MKVEFLHDYLTIFGFHKKGEVVDVPENYAAIFQSQGIAKKPSVAKKAAAAIRRKPVARKQ